MFLLSFKVFRSNFLVGQLGDLPDLPDLYLCPALGEAVVLREELLPLVFPQRGGGQVQVNVGVADDMVVLLRSARVDGNSACS